MISVGRVLLGTSGWFYDEWIGPVYDVGTKSKLSTYSKIFSTAEIDSTFYAYPSKGTVMGWLRYTDPDFVFTAKVPKLITHDEKLDPKQGAERDLKRFCDLMTPLTQNGKLGCLLIQLPPKFEFDLDRLASFLRIAPEEVRFAVEFRHASWMRAETARLLHSYNVASTIVDEPLLPPETVVTSDIAYIRWHGRGKRPWYNYRYDLSELESWVDKVESVSSKAKTVYGYFNNHYHGYAVENCVQMLELLGLATPAQTKIRKKVQNYLAQKSASTQIKLEDLPTHQEVQPTGMVSLMSSFVDPARMRRAREIPDNDVQLMRDTSQLIEARIREYHVVIDLEKKQILHDCSDWEEQAASELFCKHLARLMLTLSDERAEMIMRRLSSERNLWNFKHHTRQ